MARPAKSVKVKSGAIASEDEAVRTKTEENIRGKAEPPEAPEYLTESQTRIFGFICDQLKESEILGKLDVYVLEATAVAIDRVRAINALVDQDENLLANTALQNTRSKYQSDIWRGCNELCLSPQARAKIGGLTAAAVKEKRDPLLEALMEDD